MILNLNNLVTAEFRPSTGPLIQYIKEEYASLCSEENLNKPSDIIVMVVDNLRMKNNHVYIREPVSYDDESVFWYDSKKHLTRIDFSNFEQPGTKLFVDSNFDTHFFSIIIEYLISFKLFGSGACFCHASAVEYHGKTLVFPAWRHVGKTNLLLSFLKSGARYIADDWTVLFRDGHVLPLPKRLNLLYYNFVRYPFLMENLDSGAKALIRFVEKAMDGYFDLGCDVVETLRKKVRIRKPVGEYFQSKHPIKSKKTDYVFLLRRRMESEGNIKIIKKSTEEFTTMVSSIVEFEHSHFHTAYISHKIRTGVEDAYLEKRSILLESILRDSFQTIGKLYELSYPQGVDPQVIKNFIDDWLHNEDGGRSA